MRSDLMKPSAAACSPPRSTQPPRESPARLPAVMFSRTAKLNSRPVPLRSSVSIAMPARRASAGDLSRFASPSTAIVPVCGSAP